MVVIGKKTVIAVGFIIVALIMSAGLIFGEEKNTGKVVKIIVDAGHGAPDGGAVGEGGTIEKDINLAIAMKLSEILEGKGFVSIMTRSGDDGIYDRECKTIREMKRSDMKNRLAIMTNSNSDLFISIHMNSFENKSAHGLHIFYSENHSEIKSLAENIQCRISDITGAEAHSVMTADKRLFLMKNPPIPSILVECGFLSNAEEEKKLCTDEYQSKLAWAIADAVDEKYNSE